MNTSAATWVRRRFHSAVTIALLVAALMAFAGTGAVADDTWNPFADKDRRAAERAARLRRQQQFDPQGADQGVYGNGANNRGPYLAPMRPDDLPQYGRAPQPYPATPPQYGNGNTYQPYGAPPYQPASRPEDRADRAVGVTPYGAPGTYAAPPSQGQDSFGAAQPSVERGQLTPVISANGALPAGTWQGLDASGVEQLLGPVALPPASPALNDLLTRVLGEPAGDPQLNAVLVAALLKAGRFDAAARLQGQAGDMPSASAAPVQALLSGQLDLAAGNSERGCATVKQVVADPKKLPKHLRGEAIVMAGYCAILAGNAQAGALAAELARDSGFNRPFTVALLEAIANGGNVRAPLPRLVSTLDGLLVRHLKAQDPALVEGMLQHADAGFLQLVASDEKAQPQVRLKAAELAASRNVTSPAALAETYRAAASAPAGGSGAALERARLFSTADRQQAQFAKTRAIRSLLDSAQRDRLYHPIAVATAPIVRAMRPAPEISWFTETAIETLAAAGDYRAARQWVQSAQPGPGADASLDHWLMLLDIADPEVSDGNRGRSITVLENLALQGRFSQPALHRLATVLDALDYNVPIPLWNLASRTQQPQTGRLPETGVLSALKKASEDKQIAATLLYALRTISSEGTTATHLLGLGETIRALKRAGLEKDARRLGFEALFGDWPRAR